MSSTTTPFVDLKRELKKKLIILSILRLDPELSNESQVYIHSKLLEIKIAHDAAVSSPIDKTYIKYRRANVNNNQSLSESFKTFWDAGFHSRPENKESVNRSDMINFFRVMYCAILSCNYDDLVFTIEDEVSYYETGLGAPLNMYTFTDALIDFFELWSDLLIPSHHSKFITFMLAMIIKFPANELSELESGNKRSVPHLDLKELSEILGPYTIFKITSFNDIIECLQSNVINRHIFEFTSYSLDKCIKGQKSLISYYHQFKMIESAPNPDDTEFTVNEQIRDEHSLSSKSEIRSQIYSISNYVFSPFFDPVNLSSDEELKNKNGEVFFIESKNSVNDEDLTFKSEDGRSQASNSIIHSCASSMELLDLFNPIDGISSVRTPSFDDMKHISNSFAAFALSRDKFLIPAKKTSNSHSIYSIYQGPVAEESYIQNDSNNNYDANAFSSYYTEGNVQMLANSNESYYNFNESEGYFGKGENEEELTESEFKEANRAPRGRRVADFLTATSIKLPNSASLYNISPNRRRNEPKNDSRQGSSKSRGKLELIDDVLNDQIDESEYDSKRRNASAGNLISSKKNNKLASIERTDIFGLKESVSMDSLLFDSDMLNRRTVQEILFKSKNILTKDISVTDYFKPNMKVSKSNEKLSVTKAIKPNNRNLSNLSFADQSFYNSMTGNYDEAFNHTASHETHSFIGNSSFNASFNVANADNADNFSRSSGHSINMKQVYEEYREDLNRPTLTHNDDGLVSENSSTSTMVAANINNMIDQQSQDKSLNPDDSIFQKYSDHDDLSFDENSILSDDISETTEILTSRLNNANKNIHRNPLHDLSKDSSSKSIKFRNSNQISNNYAIIGTRFEKLGIPGTGVGAKNNDIKLETNNNDEQNRQIQRLKSNSANSTRGGKADAVRKYNFNFNKKLRPISPVGKAVKSFKENNAVKLVDTDPNENGLIYDSISLPSDPQFFVKKSRLVVNRREKVPYIGEPAFSEFSHENSMYSMDDNKSNNTMNIILENQLLSAYMSPMSPQLQTHSNLLAGNLSYQTAHLLKSAHPLTSASILSHEFALRKQAPWVPQGALDDRCYDKSNLKFAWEQQRDFDKLVKVDPSKSKVFMKKQDALREVFEDYAKSKGSRRLK